MLELTDVTLTYGALVAVDRASIRVGPGELVVITGSNGSGKSTLVRAVLGFVPLTSGTLTVDGRSAATAAEWRERRRQVAYVPQRTSPGSFPLLVGELLASSGELRAATAAARRLGLDEVLSRPVTSLSGGQLQRAYLARAVGSIDAGAVALLADEPTSALDFAGQEDVADLLADLPVTRLLVSHDAAVVARADRVLEMAGGRLRDRPA